VIKAFCETLKDGPSHEIIVIKDGGTWPAACNQGYYESTGDVIYFGADDLEPLPGWYKEVLDWLKREDELPAAKVMDPDGSFSNAIDGTNLELTHFTRVPIMRRDQWERIGPWPEDLIYYADLWVSEKGRTLGIRTRLFYSYIFLHHWSQIGRVDSKVNMDAAGWALNRHREAMV